jgi:hypothetical protein
MIKLMPLAGTHALNQEITPLLSLTMEKARKSLKLRNYPKALSLTGTNYSRECVRVSLITSRCSANLTKLLVMVTVVMLSIMELKV